jgi:hypothetical protein
MRWAVSMLVAGFLFAATIAVAESSYQNYIPLGGETLPGNSTSCQTCHVGTTGGLRNEFGVQVGANLLNGKPDWSILAYLDADGDSYSNGYELGDPEGSWSPGSTDPSGTITNPANSASFSASPLAVQRIQVPTTWAVIKALFR